MLAVTSPAQKLAQRLLRHEAGEQQDPKVLVKATERICSRLRQRLVVLIGSAGYGALFTRALHLAQMEVPALTIVQFDAGSAADSLPGALEFATTAGDSAIAAAGLAAIVAHLIGLLAIFIGEDLALRLARDAWPELAYDVDSAEEQA